MSISRIFAIIAAACLLNACIEVDNTLGLDFVPDSELLKVDQYEFSIPFTTVALDSVVSSSIQYGTIGYMNNDPFGLFYAGAVFRFIPYTLGFSYPDGAVLDSAYIEIPLYGKTVTGDAYDVGQQLTLYALNRDLSYARNYYNNSLKTSDYHSTPVSLPYTYTGGDTIRLRFTDEFAASLVSATSEEMASDSLFLRAFKGLYLAADTSTATAGSGGRVTYFDYSKASLAVNFHKSAADDTARYYYYILDQNANFNVFKHSSAALAGTGPSDHVYMEGLAGVKPFVNFNVVRDSIKNYMTRLHADVSKLAVNRAELVFDVDYPAYTMDTYPERTTLAYSKDTTYSFLTDTYQNLFDGVLNRSVQQYSYNVTYFTQGLFHHHNYDTAATATQLHLYPLNVSYDYYGSEILDLERVIYSFGVLKGPSAKLKLTYTLLK